MCRPWMVVLLLICSARPCAADEPVVVVANLEFHSAFWPKAIQRTLAALSP